MAESLLDRILVGAPTVTHPCLRCGHGVFDHGDDNRDTSCTECNCEKYIHDAQALE